MVLSCEEGGVKPLGQLTTWTYHSSIEIDPNSQNGNSQLSIDHANGVV